MQRIQVEKLLKNLRDLTVMKKLNKEGYSLNKRHISAISKELTPEEVEALLRKRNSESKGLFEVLYKNYEKFKEKSWFQNITNLRLILITICLITIVILLITSLNLF